jgi:hypothetical protein
MRYPARLSWLWFAVPVAVFLAEFPAPVHAEEKGDPQTEEIWQAIRNTRRDNNFRLTAAIKGPNSEIPIEAELNGRNFQLTTMEGVVRKVDGDGWITRDLGKTWLPTEPETWILFVILTPIQPDQSKSTRFELAGTEEENGHVLRHYRLKVPNEDKTDKNDLPQFWLVKGEKEEWYVWRAKCPVMVKDGAYPMVDVRVSDIGKIPEIKVPKGVLPPSVPADPRRKG